MLRLVACNSSRERPANHGALTIDAFVGIEYFCAFAHVYFLAHNAPIEYSPFNMFYENIWGKSNNGSVAQVLFTCFAFADKTNRIGLDIRMDKVIVDLKIMHEKPASFESFGVNKPDRLNRNSRQPRSDASLDQE